MTLSLIEHAEDEHKCDSCPSPADATIKAGGKIIWTCGPCLSRMWLNSEDVDMGIIARENKREREKRKV